MNIRETLDFQIRSTLFSMMRMYNFLVQEYGVTQGMGYTLMIIPKEGIPATSIGPIMGMGSSSLSRLLKSMESNGLVYREADQIDRRITRIFLTEKGVGLRKSIKSMVVSFNENVMKNISDDELKAYNKVSEVIKQQIDFELSKKIK